MQPQNPRCGYGIEIQTFVLSRRYVDCWNAARCQDPSDVCCRKTLDQWYGPDDVFYKVRARDGNVYGFCG